VVSPRLARLAAAALLAFGICAGSASARRRLGHVHGASAPSACRHAEVVPTSRDLPQVRAATLCLVNRERRAHGERPLRLNRRLARAAQAHSNSMAAYDYFEHIGPRGQTPLARLRTVGYISSRRGYEVGENLAWGTLALASPRSIVAAWMASPGHRANILDPRFRETGIGISPHPLRSLADGQPGAIYTQDFGVITGR
jgi:uncharacterized protein YkwD